MSTTPTAYLLLLRIAMPGTWDYSADSINPQIGVDIDVASANIDIEDLGLNGQFPSLKTPPRGTRSYASVLVLMSTYTQ